MLPKTVPCMACGGIDKGSVDPSLTLPRHCAILDKFAAWMKTQYGMYAACYLNTMAMQMNCCCLASSHHHSAQRSAASLLSKPHAMLRGHKYNSQTHKYPWATLFVSRPPGSFFSFCFSRLFLQKHSWFGGAYLLGDEHGPVHLHYWRGLPGAMKFIWWHTGCCQLATKRKMLAGKLCFNNGSSQSFSNNDLDRYYICTCEKWRIFWRQPIVAINHFPAAIYLNSTSHSSNTHERRHTNHTST